MTIQQTFIPSGFVKRDLPHTTHSAEEQCYNDRLIRRELQAALGLRQVADRYEAEGYGRDAGLYRAAADKRLDFVRKRAVGYLKRPPEESLIDHWLYRAGNSR